MRRVSYAYPLIARARRLSATKQGSNGGPIRLLLDVPVWPQARSENNP